MATTLANRAELRNAFYRLTGTSSSDNALSEHETSSNDTIHSFLYQGMREAQAWYIDRADPTQFWKASSAITWTDVLSTEGRRYWALPSDFLRMFGDADNSPLRDGAGKRWGHLIDPSDRHRRGQYFYLQNGQLSIVHGASPPGTLYLDYFYDIPELGDDVTEPDFPERDRDLIVAFAADLFSDTPMFPGDVELRGRIAVHLRKLQKRIYTRSRRTREPRRVRHARAIGSHFFGTGR